MVSRHICEATGEVVEEAAVFTVPGDAFRDKSYMDWILSNKQGESALIEEYNDFIHKQFQKVNKNGMLGTGDLLLARSEANQLQD